MGEAPALPFRESHWDDSDSDDALVDASKIVLRGAKVFVLLEGGEKAGTVTGRVVNHSSRGASKYTVQFGDDSCRVVKANDIYLLSRNGTSASISKASQDTSKQSKNPNPKASQGSARSSTPKASQDSGRSSTPKQSENGKKPSSKRPKCRAVDSNSNSSGDSDSGSSSESQHRGKSKREKSSRSRLREAAFKPDEHEQNAIWMQVARNVPYSHSRRSVTSIWRYHLKELHDEGNALDCKKQKTFTAWVTKQCKERSAFRRAESRRNGTGAIQPPTAWDEVTRKWEIAKLQGAKTKNPEAAEVMRWAATSTAASLDALSRQIEESRKRYKTQSAIKEAEANEADQVAASASPSHDEGSGGTDRPQAVFSPPNPVNPAAKSSSRSAASTEHPRTAFNAAMISLENSVAKDGELLEKILQAVHGPPAAPQLSAEHEALASALRDAGNEFKNLPAFSSNIYEKLGISSLSDFAFVSQDDVANVKLPAMQQRQLQKLAAANNVGSRL